MEKCEHCGVEKCDEGLIMNNERLIRIIEKFQENDCVHPLTCECGHNMEGGICGGEIYGERVILCCTECEATQEITPALESIIMATYDKEV